MVVRGTGVHEPGTAAGSPEARRRRAGHLPAIRSFVERGECVSPGTDCEDPRRFARNRAYLCGRLGIFGFGGNRIRGPLGAVAADFGCNESCLRASAAASTMRASLKGLSY